MYAPRGVWLDDERLIVCDSGNHRVLIWNSFRRPIKLPPMSSSDNQISNPKVQPPWSRSRKRIALADRRDRCRGKLLVADAWHHRVLVWNEIPSRPTRRRIMRSGNRIFPKSKPIGAATPSLSGMYWPYGIAWIRRPVLRFRYRQPRVLVWDSIPRPINRPT